MTDKTLDGIVLVLLVLFLLYMFYYHDKKDLDLSASQYIKKYAESYEWLSNLLSTKITRAFELGKQAGRDEQLARDFILDNIPDKKDCCVICGKKPDIIIHADCAFDKGVVSKRMNEKNDKIRELEKELAAIEAEKTAFETGFNNRSRELDVKIEENARLRDALEKIAKGGCRLVPPCGKTKSCFACVAKKALGEVKP